IFKLTDDGQWKQLCHLMHNEGVLISTVITIWQDQCPQDGGGFPLAISINLSKLCDQYASEHPEDHLWLAIKA
ncbi:MAG: hypothetical protein NTU97_04990, partial [Candidatus Magasanikbacteria bacterium]|nr:hypothetical protein [Candidatus Magasanikbacteria bacterium]